MKINKKYKKPDKKNENIEKQIQIYENIQKKQKDLKIKEIRKNIKI